MKELIDCRQIGTVKFVFTRFLALLAAAMLPVVLLSFESLLPLMKYSADTGIAVDGFAFFAGCGSGTACVVVSGFVCCRAFRRYAAVYADDPP